ncbi:MAG TPA: hypothetical protein VK116_06150, partial [Planctomycetota bacterium]|nr:hypothetical protein [Planctomycetota bacterium]
MHETISNLEPISNELESVIRELPALERASRQYSALRFASFVAAFAGLFAASSSALWLAILTLPGGLAFLLAFRRHIQILDKIEEARERAALLEEEIGRRRSRRRSRPLPPRRQDTNHPLARGLRIYAPEPESSALDPGAADDLSVLEGARSLFGLLDVSSTVVGAERLRRILENPLRSPDALRTRQNAVRALAERDDARRAILRSLVPLRRNGLTDLPALLVAPSRFADRGVLLLAARLLGTAAPLFLILSLWVAELFPLAIATIVVNLAIIGRHVRESNPARDRLLSFGPAIGGLLRLDEALGRASLDADPSWGEIRSVIASIRPSLLRLRSGLRKLALHDYGLLFEIVNIPTLWELRA